MKNIDLKDLRSLTIITGDSFSGKTKLIKEIARISDHSVYIDIDTVIGLEVTKDLKYWFKFVFNTDFEKYVNTSYTLRIFAGLNCKEGNTFIVRNPEINLSPRAISKIAKFFTHLSSKGVKVILETNSEHILNSTNYEVFSKNIDFNDVMFLHKSDKDSIEKVFVNKSGKFVDENGNLRKYPSGFFDCNSAELWKLL